MTLTSEEMAAQFHEAMGFPVALEPAPLAPDRLRLRLTLIAEEVAELLCAMLGGDSRDAELLAATFRRSMYSLAAKADRTVPDLAAIAKELCDVHVVVSGTAVEYGIPEDRVYAEVHRSNMAKVGGPIREDGKQLKPDGWTPPDIEAAMTARGDSALASGKRKAITEVEVLRDALRRAHDALDKGHDHTRETWDDREHERKREIVE
jgi:predicted HAD superfamily Cof-like phosphohydrolase